MEKLNSYYKPKILPRKTISNKRFNKFLKYKDNKIQGSKQNNEPKQQQI